MTFSEWLASKKPYPEQWSKELVEDALQNVDHICEIGGAGCPNCRILEYLFQLYKQHLNNNA